MIFFSQFFLLQEKHERELSSLKVVLTQERQRNKTVDQVTLNSSFIFKYLKFRIFKQGEYLNSLI